MPRTSSLIACFSVLLWTNGLLAQSTPFLTITPRSVTMLVGDSQPFRLVHQDGHMQRNVTWTVFDRDAFQAQDGDELVLTPKRAGDFRIDARTGDGGAEATVKVVEAASLPIGTAKWSAPTAEGCKTTKIMPAVPSPNGPDVFEMSQCQDGEYVQAYTAEGIQLWRRKISDSRSATVAVTPAQIPIATTRLNLQASSICDLVSPGTQQDEIQRLLEQRNLSFVDNAPTGRLWVVEERNAECKLWFDDKSVLTKKRKTLVSE